MSIILVPAVERGLASAVGRAHARYSRAINARQGWTGHLWQDRFASFVMDERYLLACARYVELNPLRAGLVRRAEDWPWSSARAHLGGPADGITDPAPLSNAGRTGAACSTRTSTNRFARRFGHANEGRGQPALPRPPPKISS